MTDLTDYLQRSTRAQSEGVRAARAVFDAHLHQNTAPPSIVTHCGCGKKVGATDFLRGICRACGRFIAHTRRY